MVSAEGGKSGGLFPYKDEKRKKGEIKVRPVITILESLMEGSSSYANGL